jgi:hypothetical protein
VFESIAIQQTESGDAPCKWAVRLTDRLIGNVPENIAGVRCSILARLCEAEGLISDPPGCCLIAMGVGEARG